MFKVLIYAHFAAKVIINPKQSIFNLFVSLN